MMSLPNSKVNDYNMFLHDKNNVLQDFAEHGIAPRKFQTSDSFLSEDRKRRRDQAVKSATMDTLLGSTTALADLIVPEKSVVTLVLTSCTLGVVFSICTIMPLTNPKTQK